MTRKPKAILTVEANPDFELWDGKSPYNPKTHWKLRVRLGDDYLLLASQVCLGRTFWDVGLESDVLEDPMNLNATIHSSPQCIADEYKCRDFGHAVVLEAAKLLLSTAELMGIGHDIGHDVEP